MAHEITLIPGDGSSPESCGAVQTVLHAAGVDITWDLQPAADGEISEALLASARRTRTVLMGHQRGRRAEGRPPPIVTLRKQLGLTAALRPAQSVLALNPRFPGVDLVVVREATEDVYASLEHESIPGVFESLKVTTRAASERVARFAFETARKQGRKKVTTVHKANILKKSDGLFLDTARAVAREYGDIEHEDVIVDALCMKLTLHPEWFDVLLCGNLFGDIVGDLASGLVGGRSNSPSINLGPDGLAVFTTGHGEPPGDPANPLSLLFSAIVMLRHLGDDEAADRIWTGTLKILDAGIKPIAVGGESTCPEIADAISAAVRG